MQPSSSVIRTHLLLLLPISFFILLSTTPTATATTTSAWDPRILTSILEATSWLQSTESVEKKVESQICNVSPYLSYLSAHFKLLLVTYDPEDLAALREPFTTEESVELLALQPLVYSYYSKAVLEPYRSKLAEANAPSTSFCFLDVPQTLCKSSAECQEMRNAAVCVPNYDGTTNGTCVSCPKIVPAIEVAVKSALISELTAHYLMATCDPTRLGPKPVPVRSKGQKNTKEIRYLRWFLESSFVFEKKKVGDGCSASPGLSKARAYLDVLMKKHFGNDKKGKMSLSTEGMEGVDDEHFAYGAARGELSWKHKAFYEEKLRGIEEGKYSFEEVYCSREEGLVCVEGKCRDCGDEEVKKNGELKEACEPEEVEGGQNEGKKGRGGDSSGDGSKNEGELKVILGILITVWRTVFI
jgi:hypothetical protein